MKRLSGVSYVQRLDARITELEAREKQLVAVLEVISEYDFYTKLHPDENASSEVQQAYSEGVTEGYRELASFARAELDAVKGDGDGHS